MVLSGFVRWSVQMLPEFHATQIVAEYYKPNPYTFSCSYNFKCWVTFVVDIQVCVNFLGIVRPIRLS